MSDKDVERNVRSTTVEGIRTPTERHTGGLGEKHAVSIGETTEAARGRDKILERFRRREMQRRAAMEERGTGGERERPAVPGGDDTPEQDIHSA